MSAVGISVEEWVTQGTEVLFQFYILCTSQLRLVLLVICPPRSLYHAAHCAPFIEILFSTLGLLVLVTGVA